MMLVCLDLSTGYLLLEAVAEDRTYATWKTLLEERLKGLGTGACGPWSVTAPKPWSN
jgi:hypothetical protein